MRLRPKEGGRDPPFGNQTAAAAMSAQDSYSEEREEKRNRERKRKKFREKKTHDEIRAVYVIVFISLQ